MLRWLIGIVLLAAVFVGAAYLIAARVVVTATRPSFLNLRKLTATASKEIRVRLEPPRIAIVSTHHYVNHGGSELVVYRATPADVSSGVRVGEVEYPGFPLGEVRLK